MADDLSREWCPHCHEYLKKRTKRKHKNDFYNPETKSWKKAHNYDVRDTDESQFQFLSSDEDDVNISEVTGNEATNDFENGDNLSEVLSSDEDDLDSEISSDTESESSTDMSDFEEWLDVDHEQLLKQFQEEEKRPIFELRGDDPMQLQKKVVTILLICLFIWKSVNFISNNAFEILLEFLKMYFQNIGIHSLVVAGISVIIPTTMYKFYHMLGIDRNDFTRYIVCQSCLKLHDISICNLDPQNGTVLCDNVRFQRGKYGNRCNAVLVQETHLKNGVKKFYPIKLFCFKSLLNTLEEYLCRPGFEEKCEEWRHLPESDYLSDIYNGSVWQEFLEVDNVPFLSASHNYAFILNVDWFQPFERRKDISIGVIYMVLLNLPRQLRYKRENIFLIGIIPNLKQEPKSLNSFLDPLVKELSCLWKGLTLKTNKHPDGKTIRAALLCAAADIPAARKLCGFLGHSAKLGCSKCMKSFSTSFGEGTDYGGFDRSTWKKRTNAQHLAAIKKLNATKTKTARENLEKRLGYRYSKLLDLTYMDCVRFCVIDPMHNLFLGTAKHIWKIWIQNGILSESDIELIEERITKMKFPSDVGRIPSSISSNWGGFTAKQWKTWTLTISLYALSGILPEKHVQVWHTFVRACQKICQPVISKMDAKIADALFLKFGKEFESLYGSSKVTPNIHLHCHLLDVIMDFGSIYGFWLFSFERYNGLLGNFCNNKKDIEIQLMREFLAQDQLYSIVQSLPEEIKNCMDFGRWIEKCKDAKHRDSDILSSAASRSSINEWSDNKNITINQTNKMSVKCFDEDEIKLLTQTYQTMYSDEIIGPEQLSKTYFKIDSLRVGQDFLSSKYNSQSSRSKFIMAVWFGDDGNASMNAELRPCRVKCFVEHTLYRNEKNVSHVFAIVDWFKTCELCNEECHKYRNPVSVWLNDKFESASSATFLPINNYVSKFVFGPCIGHEKNHMAISPIN